ncbi:site-2 protease family protein [Parachitinimonas caeni]|uniref:Site-2 protease family protein n=1 Tax=Parachitinimonas caeni TaxID=3031301 RepID=A0ABT7E009_9NEIS|nr:site-2 protease family protein [Parachitinimonas caeni]MDK2125645.1 site-2 protease family protein [Parachitinimonas caeni]
MGEFDLVQQILLAILPVLLALTLHEASRAYVANHLGDNTPEIVNRISLNPLRHIDLIGTVLVPLLTMITGFVFGWGKPVPIDPSKFHNPKRDMLWVASAGLGANLIMLLVWAILLKLGYSMPVTNDYRTPLLGMCGAGIQINTVMLVFNLLPIPPLPGAQIAISLLPPSLAQPLQRLEPWGMFIILGLMLTHVLDAILRPLIKLVYTLVAMLI